MHRRSWCLLLTLWPLEVKGLALWYYSADHHSEVDGAVTAQLALEDVTALSR